MPNVIIYLDPQLKSDTDNTILALKYWLTSNSTETLTKEKYGEDICDCCLNKLKLAAKYVEYMECYGFAYYIQGIENSTVYPYNCIDENMLKTLVEKSKIITTQKC